MANNTDVSVEQIFESSKGFSDISDESRVIRTTLGDDLGPPQYIAGNDKYGAAYAKNISPALQAAFDLHTGVEDGFDKTAGDLQFTGGKFLQANEVSQGLAGRLANP